MFEPSLLLARVSSISKFSTSLLKCLLINSVSVTNSFVVIIQSNIFFAKLSPRRLTVLVDLLVRNKSVQEGL